MRSLRTFLRDDRAVAPVVGFVLLFGIGVIAFSGYQAVQVPQQNAETEFQHYQDVQNDLIVVRNAISRAGQQSQSQFESIRLGTQYRERALALNPPDPAGTLRTSEEYTITLDNGTTERSVPTRFLEYQNGYNELEIDPIYYENSVLYLDAESGQRVFFEDQNLVRDNGNTVVITALQREFSRSATGRVTLELYPTDGGAPLPLGEVSVTLPTQLPNSYWQGELAGEDPIIEGSYSYNERTDTANQVSFTVESEDLEFSTVGIDNEPDPAGAVSDSGDSGNDNNNGEDDNNDDEGDPLPDGTVAFDDANGNGVYDADEDEETYSSKEIKGFNDGSVDLVIEKDVVENGNWGITANTVTVRSGVTVESTNNDLTITTNGGDLTAAGATLRAGGELSLATNGSGDIDLENATISGDELGADPGGQIVFIDGARIEDTEGDEGDLEVTSGSISGTPAYGEAEVD